MVSNDLNESPKLTFIDLFAGIGGIRKGFEDNHTKCVFSSEWNKFAAKTYEANYGEKPFGDITKINEADIPNHDILLQVFLASRSVVLVKEKVLLIKLKGHYFLMFYAFYARKSQKCFYLKT